VRTREHVARLLDEGHSQNEIARRLGIAKSTVAYHARNLGREPDERCNRRYDWAEVQRYYDEGHTVTQCQERFGFSRETWHAARNRGAVVARPREMTIERLCAAPRNRSHLKVRLIAAGLLENVCAECGIDSWRGAPLSLALHHVNGDGKDNRLENLMLLCPNCHSQTENFAGRNKGRLRLVDDDAA
jgi:5-methylcytosine-specific restriction endonuclease McrA